MEVACPTCNQVFQDQQRCPKCGTALTRDWSGKVAVISPDRSRIAKEMDIQLKGVYALKI